MSDPLDELFSDLDARIDDFYPGSKRKRRQTPKQSATKSPEDWSAKPVVKDIRGKKVEMYTVGALAQALNKSQVSIRLWIRKGYLPSAPFRLPSMTAPDGRVMPGRRLYTREMIETARHAFESRGLIDKARIEWSEHQDLTREILQAWDQIKRSVTTSDTTAEN